jgi:hypothetical protein
MKRSLSQIVVAAATLFVSQAVLAGTINGRFLESNDKAYVMDLTTGLIWTRCLVGTKYQNGTCVGQPKSFTREEALSYIHSTLPGWRIPSTKEAASLVECDSREDGAILNDPAYKNSAFNVWNGKRLSFDEQFGFFVIKGDNFFPHACSGSSSLGHANTSAFPITKPQSQYHYNYGLWTSNIFGNDQHYPEYYSFEIFDSTPYFRVHYVYCGPGGCYGGGHSELMAVVHESELSGTVLFDALSPQNLQQLASKIPPTTLVWKSSNGSTALQSKLQFPYGSPSMERLMEFGVHELVVADVAAIPAVPSLPVRTDFVANAAVSPKGEFETTAAYEERRKQGEIEAEGNAEKKYQDALNNYQLTLKQHEQRLKQLEGDQASPQYYRQKLLQAWENLAPTILGNPVLTDIRYDADKQEFLATLRSTVGNFSKEISAPVPLEKAAKLKPDLVSGKLAPKVEFEFPSMSVTWSLVENAALRAKKFDAATTVGELENLIREYPDSVEAKSARTRLFKVAKNSKELAAAIERNRAWPEAAVATQLLRETQEEEFQKARTDNSSWSYDQFLENFGGSDPKKLVAQAHKARSNAKVREDQQARESQAQWERDRPAREARERAQNLCRAQINTCIASCPQIWGELSKSYIGPDYACKSQCESVSCN